MSKEESSAQKEKGAAKVSRVSPNDMEEAWETYQTHDIYHIEGWQGVTFIPGRFRLLRVHYIYDAAEEKAFIRDFKNRRVELVTEREEIKKLNEIIQHPIKSLHQGVFVRKLQCARFSQLLYLLLIMNKRDELVLAKLPVRLESKKKYQKRREKFLKTIFNIIISEK